jgi:hypothetical protein
MPKTLTDYQYNELVKKSKMGWASYFRELENSQNNAVIIWQVVNKVNKEVNEEGNELTDYAQGQIQELLIQLKKQIECPICLEVINPKEVVMTNCGHKYCKQCLNTIKTGAKPECAVCRQKIWVKKTR